MNVTKKEIRFKDYIAKQGSLPENQRHLTLSVSEYSNSRSSNYSYKLQTWLNTVILPEIKKKGYLFVIKEYVTGNRFIKETLLEIEEFRSSYTPSSMNSNDFRVVEGGYAPSFTRNSILNTAHSIRFKYHKDKKGFRNSESSISIEELSIVVPRDESSYYIEDIEQRMKEIELNISEKEKSIDKDKQELESLNWILQHMKKNDVKEEKKNEVKAKMILEMSKSEENTDDAELLTNISELLSLSV